MKNKAGELNFKQYLNDLNDLPSDRYIYDKYTGRKTLMDSFLYAYDEDQLKELNVKQYKENFLSEMKVGVI